MEVREVRNVWSSVKLDGMDSVDRTITRGMEEVVELEGKMGREKLEESSDDELETRSTIGAASTASR